MNQSVHEQVYSVFAHRVNKKGKVMNSHLLTLSDVASLHLLFRYHSESVLQQ